MHQLKCADDLQLWHCICCPFHATFAEHSWQKSVPITVLGITWESGTCIQNYQGRGCCYMLTEVHSIQVHVSGVKAKQFGCHTAFPAHLGGKKKKNFKGLTQVRNNVAIFMYEWVNDGPLRFNKSCSRNLRTRLLAVKKSPLDCYWQIFEPIHYALLTLYCGLDMKAMKINKILKFCQASFLHPYTEDNVSCLIASRTRVESNLYRLHLLTSNLDF